MSPRESFEAWVSQHAVKFIVYAFLVGVAWMSVTSALAQKADKQEVESVQRDVKTILTLICRQYPNDSRCTNR